MFWEPAATWHHLKYLVRVRAVLWSLGMPAATAAIIASCSPAADCPRCASAAPCPPPKPAQAKVLVPVDLALHLIAGFQACTGSVRGFDVQLDGSPVGALEVPCSEIVGVVRAPPPTASLTIANVAPGDHVLRIGDRGSSLVGEETITLPALQVTADGRGLFAGGHVRIWVDDREIRIDQPSAMPQKTL